MMLKINHQIPTLGKCREIAAQKPEFKEIKKNGYVVFDYMINDSHTFDDPQSIEMRGLAFNPESGNVVGVLLHIFFKYGEKPDQNIVLDGTKTKTLTKRIVHLMLKNSAEISRVSLHSLINDVEKVLLKLIHAWLTGTIASVNYTHTEYLLRRSLHQSRCR